MPYYSELGVYTPSSTYTSPLLKGPYSNHSSIIASNILPLPKQIHRSNFRGFKPHLTTISESNAITPLRRISSPKVIYHSSPKVRIQRPIKINTADIDVSVNKYNNYVERGSAEKRSPTSRPETPSVQQPEKEAKPNTNIRRDRATIRLQTIHKDALEKEIGTIKSWRDKFKPEELVTEARVKRKSPGEKLKEKFLIKSQSKEKAPQIETPKLTRRPSVKKSASFKDICNVITSDAAIEDLNPGQPIDIRRRQSRQVSHEDIIKEIERTSSNLSVEEVELLDALIKAENEVGLYDTPPIIEDKPKTRKKKVTRKKTVEGLIKKTDTNDLPLMETDSDLDKPSSKLRKDSSLQNMVKDISQVEIEMIPVKQKPIITASVGDIEEKTKNNLKLVVEDYQVQESPTPPKKERKFRFNVTVEEFPVKKKINFPKHKLSDHDFGVMHSPHAKPFVVNNVVKRNNSKHTGTITEQPKILKRKEPPVEDAKIKKKLLKSLSEVQVSNKNDNLLQKSGSNDSICSNFTVLVNKTKSDEGFSADNSRTSSGKLKIISIEKNLPDKTAESLIKTTRKDLKENTFLSKGDLGQKKPQPLWAQRNKVAKILNKTPYVEEKLKEPPKDQLDKQIITSRTETKEIQSPVEDKITETVLDENNKTEIIINKPPPVEEKIQETQLEDAGKELRKEEQVETIPPSVADKSTEGVVDGKDKSRENTFLFQIDSEQDKPLWTQTNEAAKLLNKTISVEDEKPETQKVDSEKQVVETDSIKTEPKELETKEIQCPEPEKSTDEKDKQKENKLSSKVDPEEKKPLWARRNEAAKLLNKSTSVEDKTKDTSIVDVEKRPAIAIGSVKPETKEAEAKQIQSSDLKISSSDSNTDQEVKQEEPIVIEEKYSSLVEVKNNAQIQDISDTIGKDTATIPASSPNLSSLIRQDSSTVEDKTPMDDIRIAQQSTSEKTKSPTQKVIDKIKTKDSPKTMKSGLKNNETQGNKASVSSEDTIKDLKSEKQEEIIVPSPPSDDLETKKPEKSKQSPVTADDQFWNDTNSLQSELALDITEEEPESLEEDQKKMTSKRSLIEKANKNDPDLKIFEPPTPPPPEPVKEPSPEPSFVPLQSNRLSQWMHPWKKPEQKDEPQVELFAKPKFIRARHIPRRWQQNVNSESEDSTTTDGDSSGEDSEADDEDVEEDEEEEVEEEEDGGAKNKIGASTSSTDSGFESGRTKNKECEVNCHKKCQKLMANLCGINQKLVVEAIEKVRKGSIDSRDSPGGTLTPASNPAFALDFNDLPEEVSQSSTYQSFQRSGRITPPATTIPRFRKYCVEDFNFLKVLGKGSFGKVLLAELKGTEYYYAVKCLKKDVVLEDDDVECTLIERKVLALGTKHPYLCHLLCTFQTESHLFFVMEYLNGGDLMFHIQMERRFSETRARFYGAEIVSGLKFLHNKGIVYRDLKLDNILLDFDGHVRIADFGMCKLQIFLDRMADTFCGTPDYMAPEIIKGQHYNQCVDWWSFGVLLYEMLLGQSPFSGCDEDELFWSICNEKPVIPRFLSAEATSVLTQFLEKDANKRLGNRFSPYGDIQDHPFFQPIDWPALEARKLEPPFKPNLQHPLDTQYFDKTFTTEKAKLTPIEGPILQSMDQTQFQGFSYTNPNATDK